MLSGLRIQADINQVGLGWPGPWTLNPSLLSLPGSKEDPGRSGVCGAPCMVACHGTAPHQVP